MYETNSTISNPIRSDSVHTVQIDDDIEKQVSKVEVIPPLLKGILKKKSHFDDAYDKIKNIAMKISVILLVTLLLTPLLISDIYYAYTDTTCVNIYPYNFNLNLKLYLLISAYYSFCLLIIILIFTCFIYDLLKHNPVFLSIIRNLTFIFVGIFPIIWSTIGAFIFWGNIYNTNYCNSDTSTYLFISLLIKITASLSYLFHNKNNG